MENKNEWAGISDFQTYLFNSGDNYKSYEMLGPHKLRADGREGWRFAVWAPNARSVRVAGEFNGWNGENHWLSPILTTGIWYGFFTDVPEGSLYKYVIEDYSGELHYKADPYATESELRPGTASVVRDIKNNFHWTDKAWLSKRGNGNPFKSPLNIYEAHAGSWRIHENGDFYTYRELADEIIPYVKDMGYTHIEFMPLMEYPFDGSWGYQVTGYFSATSRYGTSADLKYLINKCHKEGIGVIMDWVPAHFPRDAHGLRMFDGTPVYEYADPRMGEHKDWGTMVFDYSKSEVVSFLMSSAYFWAEEYHVDGLRVDAVSSMLYRNYSRNDGEWIPNVYGGNGNLEAVELFKKINRVMCTEFPKFLMIAEESTSWPLVTAPPENDGLGFVFKWNMGWMNDTLRYVSMDPYFRKDNHSLLTFMMMYAYSENYILPLSHDEVVHGKHSLIDKMYGSYEEKFDAYKAFMGYYMSVPGKKLMFMGGEFGQFLEWRFDDQLEWNVLENERHVKLKTYMKDLNNFYLAHPAMWQNDDSWDGFKWINDADNENSVVSYIRMSDNPEEDVVIVANFTPIDREIYKLGVRSEGDYAVIIHSNSTKYGGNRMIRRKIYKAKKAQFGDMEYTIEVSVDANSTMYLMKNPRADKAQDIKIKSSAGQRKAGKK